MVVYIFFFKMKTSNYGSKMCDISSDVKPNLVFAKMAVALSKYWVFIVRWDFDAFGYWPKNEGIEFRWSQWHLISLIEPAIVKSLAHVFSLKWSFLDDVISRRWCISGVTPNT